MDVEEVDALVRDRGEGGSLQAVQVEPHAQVHLLERLRELFEWHEVVRFQGFLVPLKQLFFGQSRQVGHRVTYLREFFIFLVEVKKRQNITLEEVVIDLVADLFDLGVLCL